MNHTFVTTFMSMYIGYSFTKATISFNESLRKEILFPSIYMEMRETNVNDYKSTKSRAMTAANKNNNKVKCGVEKNLNYFTYQRSMQ